MRRSLQKVVQTDLETSRLATELVDGKVMVGEEIAIELASG
jgi:hypothetical protein